MKTPHFYLVTAVEINRIVHLVIFLVSCVATIYTLVSFVREIWSQEPTFTANRDTPLATATTTPDTQSNATPNSIDNLTPISPMSYASNDENTSVASVPPGRFSFLRQSRCRLYIFIIVSPVLNSLLPLSIVWSKSYFLFIWLFPAMQWLIAWTLSSFRFILEEAAGGQSVVQEALEVQITATTRFVHRCIIFGFEDAYSLNVCLVRQIRLIFWLSLTALIPLIFVEWIDEMLGRQTVLERTLDEVITLGIHSLNAVVCLVVVWTLWRFTTQLEPICPLKKVRLKYIPIVLLAPLGQLQYSILIMVGLMQEWETSQVSARPQPKSCEEFCRAGSFVSFLTQLESLLAAILIYCFFEAHDFDRWGVTSSFFEAHLFQGAAHRYRGASNEPHIPPTTTTLRPKSSNTSQISDLEGPSPRYSGLSFLQPNLAASDRFAGQRLGPTLELATHPNDRTSMR